MLTNSYREHILVLLIASLLPCGVSMLFMAEALLITHYTPFLELLSIVCLTSMLSSFASVVYKLKLISMSILNRI